MKTNINELKELIESGVEPTILYATSCIGDVWTWG